MPKGTRELTATNSFCCSDSTDLNTNPQNPPMRELSLDLLGVRVDALTRYDIVDAIADAVDYRAPCIIGNHNLHSLYLLCREPKMREFYASADYVNIDGMSLVFLGWLLRLPLKPEHRTNCIDLLPLLAERAARCQWRLFFLGSRPGVPEKAAQTLRIRYPGLQISTHHGYFDTNPCGEENQRVLAEIRRSKANILLVGMGMPRQETWIVENRGNIAAGAILTCGGFMDLVAGEIPTAPRWLGPLGLEWLFRLLSEPARLWRRYLVEPWLVLFRVAKQSWRHGRPSIGAEGGFM